MSAGDQFKPIDMIELRGDLVPKQPASPTWGYCPSADIFGVAPDKIAKGTFMRDFLSASNDADLVDCADFWA